MERRIIRKKAKRHDFIRWFNKPKINGTLFILGTWILFAILYLYPLGLCAIAFPEVDEQVDFLYPGPHGVPEVTPPPLAEIFDSDFQLFL